eukprot:CAMPEP_0179102236 /NCGR_PEP_ID=MMETSP0796-20121207/47308_1 /TAXON_ID=73915 /ORGANISM="Pyrodinium bahamense, Strain pbaha01" /LENGTH=126 /DNA_ID=CAMNT_0020800105 /DNA_START=290 /DNA_END=671 /DNA_ORIENTATION=+
MGSNKYTGTGKTGQDQAQQQSHDDAKTDAPPIVLAPEVAFHLDAAAVRLHAVAAMQAIFSAQVTLCEASAHCAVRVALRAAAGQEVRVMSGRTINDAGLGLGVIQRLCQAASGSGDVYSVDACVRT